MILVRNLRLGIDEPEASLKKLAAKELGVPERDILSLKITKKSLDARKKNDIHRLYAVAAAFQISTGYKAAADTRLRQHAGRKHRIAITYSCLVYHSSISCVFQLIIIIVQIFVVISDI